MRYVVSIRRNIGRKPIAAMCSFISVEATIAGVRSWTDAAIPRVRPLGA